MRFRLVLWAYSLSFHPFYHSYSFSPLIEYFLSSSLLSSIMSSSTPKQSLCSLLFFPLPQPGYSSTVLPPLIDRKILIGKRWVCLIMRLRRRKKKGWRSRGMEIDWEKKRIRWEEGWECVFLWHGLLTLAGLAGYFSTGFETEIHRGYQRKHLIHIVHITHIHSHTRKVCLHKASVLVHTHIQMEINPGLTGACVYVCLFLVCAFRVYMFLCQFQITCSSIQPVFDTMCWHRQYTLSIPFLISLFPIIADVMFPEFSFTISHKHLCLKTQFVSLSSVSSLF